MQEREKKHHQTKYTNMHNEIIHEGKETSNSLSYQKVVGKAAALIQSDILSSAEIASLRRVSVNQPFSPALWKLLILLDLDDFQFRNPEWERHWATVFMILAHTSGLHNPKVPFGQALATSGWSELRFLQLMRAKGEKLEILLKQVSHFLAGKNVETNWTDAARLLFHQTGEIGESVRLSISRDYFSKLHRIQRESQ